MTATDITKPTSHIYWLWLAIFALAGACISGYLSLRGRDDCLAEKISNNELKLQVQLAEITEKISNNELKLQVQLAEIKAQLSQMNITLFELKEQQKKDIQRRIEP